MIEFVTINDKVYVFGYYECDCGAIFKDQDQCPSCGEYAPLTDLFPAPLLTPELVDQLDEEDRRVARFQLLLENAYTELVHGDHRTYFRLYSGNEVIATFKDEATFKLLVHGGERVRSVEPTS